MGQPKTPNQAAGARFQVRHYKQQLEVVGRRGRPRGMRWLRWFGHPVDNARRVGGFDAKNSEVEPLGLVFGCAVVNRGWG